MTDTMPWRITQPTLATARRIARQENRSIQSVFDEAMKLYASWSDSKQQQPVTVTPDDWHRLTDDLTA